MGSLSGRLSLSLMICPIRKFAASSVASFVHSATWKSSVTHLPEQQNINTCDGHLIAFLTNVHNCTTNVVAMILELFPHHGHDQLEPVVVEFLHPRMPIDCDEPTSSLHIS